MAPRRSSDRIAIKAQQREEEDKQAEMEKQQEKERLAEMKKQEAEAKEKERQILAEKRQRGLFIVFVFSWVLGLYMLQSWFNYLKYYLQKELEGFIGV